MNSFSIAEGIPNYPFRLQQQSQQSHCQQRVPSMPNAMTSQQQVLQQLNENVQFLRSNSNESNKEEIASNIF